MTSAIDMVVMLLAMRMTMIGSEWWWFIWCGLTYTPPQSTGRGIQNGCAGRRTFKKNSVYWGICAIKTQWAGWQSREVVQTAKRRWQGRFRGPEPGPRLRCAGSDTWGDLTLNSSILATEFFWENIPTRPRFLLRSTTFRSPKPHRRPQQRSPGSDRSTCKRSWYRGNCEMFFGWTGSHPSPSFRWVSTPSVDTQCWHLPKWYPLW